MHRECRILLRIMEKLIHCVMLIVVAQLLVVASEGIVFRVYNIVSLFKFNAFLTTACTFLLLVY